VPRAASLLVALDAPAEEVEALLDVTDGGLLLRQPQPTVASTAATCSPSASVCCRVPATNTTKSSAYRTIR